MAVLGAGALLVAACAPEGRCREGGDICVLDAYVVRPAGDAPTAFYATIANDGASGDTLVGLTVPAYELAMLHATRDGAMEMVQALSIPARSIVRLRPGGLHGMLEGPRRALVPGDSVAMTLRFVRAGDLPVTASAIDYADLDRVLPP